LKVIKDIWKNKARAVLVTLSIAVGVFAIGMTTNAGIIIRRDLNEPYGATNPASTTLYISPFEEELARAVEQMQEVREAEPKRLEIVQVYLGDGEWMDLELNALPDYDNVRINQFTPEFGQPAPDRRQILLERMTAEALSVSVGEMLTVRLPGQERSYDLEVVGIVHDMHKLPPQWFEQGAGYVTMRTLWWMGAGTHYNALDIVVAENPTDKEHILRVAGEARDRVIERNGYQLVGTRSFQSDPGKHYFSDIISAVLIVLMAMGAMCILLGAGLVINTSSALIAQQVRQIGIIRSIGGLRRQIALMYLANILIFSLLALLIAVPLGLVGAKGLAVMIAEQLNFDVTRVDLPLSIALVQVAVGVLVPLGAALVPVMTGTSMSVYEAIYQEGNITSVNKGMVDKALKQIKVLASPIVLAMRNTFRHKARLAFTLVTLTLAGATFMAAFSAHLTLREKISSTGRYFLFDVALEVPDGGNRRLVEREALREPDVEIAEAWYRTSAQMVFLDDSESESIEVVALPPDSITLDPRLVAGRWLQAGDTNAIVVNEDALNVIPDLQVGDEVALRISGTDFNVKRRQMRHQYVVVGIVSRHLNGPRIYAPYDYFTRVNDALDQANLVRVRASSAALQDGDYQENLAIRLEERFEDANLGGGSSETQYEVVVSNLGNFDMLLSILLLMAGLLAVVGGLGLAGTMGLNVLERTREIGVLRAVGASNASVRKIVLFEGIVVGLASWMFSTLAAFPFGSALTNAISIALLQSEAEVLYSTFGMGLWLALVLVIASLASLIPAHRASQLTVREVLAYE
jgi:putative ABC transport system permease protein